MADMPVAPPLHDGDALTAHLSIARVCQAEELTLNHRLHGCRRKSIAWEGTQLVITKRGPNSIEGTTGLSEAATPRLAGTLAGRAPPYALGRVASLLRRLTM